MLRFAQHDINEPSLIATQSGWEGDFFSNQMEKFVDKDVQTSYSPVSSCPHEAIQKTCGVAGQAKFAMQS
jgi:hypothetical protein